MTLLITKLILFYNDGCPFLVIDLEISFKPGCSFKFHRKIAYCDWLVYGDISYNLHPIKLFNR